MKYLYRKNNGRGVWNSITRADFLDLATGVGATWLNIVGAETKSLKAARYLYVGKTCIASMEEA